MKKIFTLAVMAIMTLCANAQTWTVTEGSTYEANQEITDVANCKLTLGNDAWPAPKAYSDMPGYTAYLPGKNNAKDADGKGYKPESKNLPTTGAYVVFSPSATGTLTVGFIMNADKGFYVTDGEGTCINNKITSIVDKEGATVTLTDDNTFTDKVYGNCTFPVEANKSYYVFGVGTKASFFGFTFTEGSTGISTVKASKAADNAPAYNIAGQRVSKTAKGIVIVNGKKYVNK